MNITENERWIIINALHTAACQYLDDANASSGNARLVQQFTQQADEAIALARTLEIN
jgi:hypothetical protein